MWQLTVCNYSRKAVYIMYNIHTLDLKLCSSFHIYFSLPLPFDDFLVCEKCHPCCLVCSLQAEWWNPQLHKISISIVSKICIDILLTGRVDASFWVTSDNASSSSPLGEVSVSKELKYCLNEITGFKARIIASVITSKLFFVGMKFNVIHNTNTWAADVYIQVIVMWLQVRRYECI